MHGRVSSGLSGVHWGRRRPGAFWGISATGDPLPLLLGTTWGRLLVNREPIAAPQGCAEPYGPDGLWVSEVICPTNERPGDGYVDVSALYTLALR